MHDSPLAQHPGNSEAASKPTRRHLLFTPSDHSRRPHGCDAAFGVALCGERVTSSPACRVPFTCCSQCLRDKRETSAGWNAKFALSRRVASFSSYFNQRITRHRPKIHQVEATDTMPNGEAKAVQDRTPCTALLRAVGVVALYHMQWTAELSWVICIV